ncbi:DUF2322 family protein [Pasteurella canis]|uniref:Uncharacterized protein conserved in bacteria n=1 Tax=Pasteurella canis TaxID=753 RepID=A0A379EWV1_9PAST|nr:DUF2322 family protein [Pasteurella canis]MXN88914.1 DUF2322 family protein [Pasteurella canis]UAX41931.1 DUF2322 family protein [Pasteurella canis]UAY77485.1 DUF2322 family protein [Pasteurella canis]UDW83505.1 DUF2322 family protein [Pasteurella canis]UEA16574.1 DUF2322 family protein [Pasteurella canis]
MDFNTILTRLPTIEHLTGLAIMAGSTQVHYIPAVTGKLGSLRVYYALAKEFNGKLNRISAQKGLALFAEHTEDAKQNTGKHPNIDLLFHVIANDLEYHLVPQS